MTLIQTNNPAVLRSMTDTLLDNTCSPDQLHQVLDDFAQHCSQVTSVHPNPSFNGWADDTFLEHGVAINAEAAAFCIKDYNRSITFIRGVFAAIKTAQARFNNTPINILYAGCGPYATLLLPLLTKFKPGELDIHLLDIHQRSLDSVRQLLEHFELTDHTIKMVSADACHYQHPNTLQVIIAETMQKSLEQEPQFAVTANLAPQLCQSGIFIPEKIEVELCLANLTKEKQAIKGEVRANVRNRLDVENLIITGQRHPLATLFTLIPEHAFQQMAQAKYNPITEKHELARSLIQIPKLENLNQFDALIFTRLTVFGEHTLKDYESEISLPYHCNDLSPLEARARYDVCYQLGAYPRFNLEKICDE